jgi:mannose-1-phosphate guanylyltransferase
LKAADSGLESFFAAVKPISVDVGVMERSTRVRVLPGDFGWDDVGTWGALRRVKPEDAEGNVSSGTVHALDARGNVIHAEGNTVVLYGVSDLVVVTRDGLTLVTTTDKSSDLKALFNALPPEILENK